MSVIPTLERSIDTHIGRLRGALRDVRYESEGSTSLQNVRDILRDIWNTVYAVKLPLGGADMAVITAVTSNVNLLMMEYRQDLNATNFQQVTDAWMHFNSSYDELLRNLLSCNDQYISLDACARTKAHAESNIKSLRAELERIPHVIEHNEEILADTIKNEKEMKRALVDMTEAAALLKYDGGEHATN